MVEMILSDPSFWASHHLRAEESREAADKNTFDEEDRPMDRVVASDWSDLYFLRNEPWDRIHVGQQNFQSFDWEAVDASDLEAEGNKGNKRDTGVHEVEGSEDGAVSHTCFLVKKAALTSPQENWVFE